MTFSMFCTSVLTAAGLFEYALPNLLLSNETWPPLLIVRPIALALRPLAAALETPDNNDCCNCSTCTLPSSGPICGLALAEPLAEAEDLAALYWVSLAIRDTALLNCVVSVDSADDRL